MVYGIWYMVFCNFYIFVFFVFIYIYINILYNLYNTSVKTSISMPFESVIRPDHSNHSFEPIISGAPTPRDRIVL